MNLAVSAGILLATVFLVASSSSEGTAQNKVSAPISLVAAVTTDKDRALAISSGTRRSPV